MTEDAGAEAPWNLGDAIQSEGRGPIEDPTGSLRSQVGTGLADLDWVCEGLDGLVLVCGSEIRLAQALVLEALKATTIWRSDRSAVVFTPTYNRERVTRALLGSVSQIDPRRRHGLSRDETRTWLNATDVLEASVARLYVDDTAGVSVPQIAARATALEETDTSSLALVAILDLEAVVGDQVQVALKGLSHQLGKVPILAVTREPRDHRQRDGSPCVADMVINLEAEPSKDLEAERAVRGTVTTGCGSTVLAQNLRMLWSPLTSRLVGIPWDDHAVPGRDLSEARALEEQAGRPLCPSCGTLAIRRGACWFCPEDGSSFG